MVSARRQGVFHGWNRFLTAAEVREIGPTKIESQPLNLTLAMAVSSDKGEFGHLRFQKRVLRGKLRHERYTNRC